MEEWEAIAKKFESATHYREKALHRVLSQDIAPAVISEMRVSFPLIDAITTPDQPDRILKRSVRRKRQS